MEAAAKADALLLTLDVRSSEKAQYELIKEFIRIRYLLKPEDMTDESFNYLGEASLARSIGIPLSEVFEKDTNSLCGSDSASMTKKLLLVKAANATLGIAIEERKLVRCAT